jgi:hypothetical protein
MAWGTRPENRLDKPEPTPRRSQLASVAMGEPIVGVERLVGSVIPERFEHVVHSTNLRVGDRTCACRLDDHPCDFDWKLLVAGQSLPRGQLTIPTRRGLLPVLAVSLADSRRPVEEPRPTL